jgi:prepilin-type N-terminal cleavage/methylation domain-containing protein
MRTKHAFTLIEILVVLTIVGILALMALSSFGTARQKARMDIAADALVSVYKQQQSLARSGRGGTPTCYGIYFNMNDPVQVYTVQAPYVRVDATRADFCNIDQGKFVVTPFEAFEDNRLKTVSKFGLEVEELMVMFRPPEASVLVGDSGDISSPQATDNSILKIVFESASGKDERAVAFDVASGLAEKTEVNATLKPLKPLKPFQPLKSPTPTVPLKPSLLKQVSP